MWLETPCTIMQRGQVTDTSIAIACRALHRHPLQIYRTPKLNSISSFQLMREVMLHTQLHQPHILLLHAAFEQGDNVVLVEEYAEGGDLFSLIEKSGGRLPERAAASLVIAPLLRALQYLHGHGLLHRDIKLENLMFVDAAATHVSWGLMALSKHEMLAPQQGHSASGVHISTCAQI